MLSAAKGFLTRPTVAGLVGNPFTDNFATLDTTTKWPTTYGSPAPSIVSGRLRVSCTSGFAHVQSGARFDLAATPVWLQIPTVQAAGTGTRILALALQSGGNTVAFYIQGSTRGVYMSGTGITGSTNINYNSTDHQWLRFSISGGNLLFEAAPDGTTWSTLRSVPVPSWITSNLVSFYIDNGYYGTETADFSEFDNFRL